MLKQNMAGMHTEKDTSRTAEGLAAISRRTMSRDDE